MLAVSRFYFLCRARSNTSGGDTNLNAVFVLANIFLAHTAYLTITTIKAADNMIADSFTCGFIYCYAGNTYSGQDYWCSYTA